jgi:hypothetical protein
MPSIEEKIAELANDVSNTLSLPNQVVIAAQTQIALVGNEYQTRIATLVTDVFVAGTNGLDTNPGTLASPVKTIQRALAMTPRGGRCRVLLKENIIVAAPIFISGRDLNITSDSSVRHTISFTRELVTAVTPNLRQISGFRLDGICSVNFSGVGVILSELDGTWPGFSDTGFSALIGWSSSSTISLTQITMLNCDLNIPATPFGALLDGSSVPFMLLLSAITFVGAATSLNGKVIRGITAVGGTAASKNILTNLATV